MEQLEQVISAGGALEALQEAKAAGKIGHIGLTAHSLEVFEKALELDWVETIMFPYNIVETQATDLIKKCAEKNIGFIDMKPLAGGAIEDATLALRFICANPDVTVVIPGMFDLKEIEQNLAAAEDKSPLTEEELAKMEELVENFYKAYRSCWLHEKKGHGFDVQDIRLGGLKMRYRSCRERLSAYLAGEIAAIEELEEQAVSLDVNFRMKWSDLSPNAI